MDGSGMLTSFFFGGGYEMQSGGRGLTFCFYIRGIADSQTLMAIIGTYGDSLSLQVQKKQKGLSAGSQAKTGSNGAVSHSPQWKVSAC